MKNIEEIKSIAFLYFQGKISLEDEKVLFDFINDSNENMKLFRQWESEWISDILMIMRWLINGRDCKRG